MGVRTTADEKIDEARRNIREATKSLSEIVVDECWGHDEYNEEFKTVLREVLNELISLKIKLGS